MFAARFVASALAMTFAGCGFQVDAQRCPAETDGCTIEPDARPDSAACTPAWSTYVPTNVTPCVEGPAPSPLLTLDAGAFVLTPQTGAVTKNGAPFATVTTHGTSPRIVSVLGFVVTASAALRIVGADPTIVVVHGNATIDGIITVSATGSTPGAGAALCAAMSGGNADGLLAKSAGGGGAGGAFGTAGAAGGNGDTSTQTKTPGGGPMSPQGGETLVPLRGGCRGADGGEEHPTADASPGNGGGGGGAVQLSVRDTLTVGSAARVQSNGGGGRRATNVSNGTGTHAGAGGGGGGAGGAIFLEAHQMSINPLAVLCANGGGGGGGSHDSADGADGSDGFCSLTRAIGGAGDGNGGDGAFSSTGATVGQPGGGDDGGGGGGGGGAGRIRVRAVMGARPVGFVSTPAAVID